MSAFRTHAAPALSHPVVSTVGYTSSNVNSITYVSAAGRLSNFTKFVDSTSQPVFPSDPSTRPIQSTPLTDADRMCERLGLRSPQLLKLTMKWPRSRASLLVFAIVYRHVAPPPDCEVSTDT